MEIRRKQDSGLTRLGDVKPGEVFEYGGEIYMRTTLPEGDEGCYVCLKKGTAFQHANYGPIRVLRGAFVEE